jgi:hypothetical protein
MFLFWLKTDKNTGTLHEDLHTSLCATWKYLAEYFTKRKLFRTKVVDKYETVSLLLCIWRLSYIWHSYTFITQPIAQVTVLYKFCKIHRIPFRSLMVGTLVRINICGEFVISITHYCSEFFSNNTCVYSGFNEALFSRKRCYLAPLFLVVHPIKYAMCCFGFY